MTSDAANPPASAAPLVLLVDDNPINLLVAREMLMSLGAQVDTAVDGREAVKALQSRRYDIVFMDLQMPVLDGLSATRQLRADESAAHKPRVPVVAVTANAMMGDRAECLAAGMDDYLTKPVRREQFAQMLARYVPR
jgi:CheY-like chemotaxis protein